VFSLSFHTLWIVLLTILLLPLQIHVLSCVFATLVLPSATSFVCCQIHFGHFFSFFYTMVVIPMKEVRLVVVVYDLEFRIRDVAFEAKVFNSLAPLIEANKSMEDLGYAYLHCDLLDMVALITITLKVKSPYIELHE
jgi:hypothetical protein